MEKLNPALNYNYNSNLSIEEFHSNLYANTSSFETTKNNRTIYDPVHGHLELEDYAWEIIDTPEFQRLRNLFQLGNCNYVFPGATHTRFEHSIGVGYLSNRLASHLVESVNKNKSFRSSNINTDFNLKCATLAGLLHDLGHGPFSHLFDRKVIKTLE
jgi:HD superfamily phosphohydrolase